MPGGGADAHDIMDGDDPIGWMAAMFLSCTGDGWGVGLVSMTISDGKIGIRYLCLIEVSLAFLVSTRNVLVVGKG